MEIIDLTKPLDSGMDVYPGDPDVTVEIAQTHEQDGWELRKLTLGSHTGTHADAPSHAHSGARNLDQVPLHQFCGEAVCVRATDVLPSRIGLVFCEHLTNTRADDIISAEAPFVAAPSLDEDIERALLAKDIVTFDGITNTDQLPTGSTFTFAGLPLRIRGGDGSPVRAVAILP